MSSFISNSGTDVINVKPPAVNVALTLNGIPDLTTLKG